MQRLIADAAAAKGAQEELGLSVDGTSMSFDNIVKAIQVVQYEQGIAGTTAKEAATTIEGAFNMTKAAWENLVAGFANPDADLGALMDNLIVSIVGDQQGTGLLNRLIPAVERAFQGIGQFVQKAAPIISQYLPGLMSALLPGLLSAATSLVIGLVKALPTLITIVIQQIPSIVGQIKTALIEAAPALIEGGKNLMKSIYDGLTQEFPKIKPVLDGLGKIFSTAFGAIGKVVDFFKKHFETIKTVVVAVGGAIAGIGLVGIIGGIAGAIGTVVTAIGGLISALSMIKSFAGLVSVITTLAGGPLVLIPALIGAIVAAVIYLWNTSETFRNFVLELWAKIQEIVAGAVQVFTNLGTALAAIWQDIVNTAKTVWNTLKDVVSKGVNAVKNVITKVINAVKSFISKAWSAITQTISNAWNAITSKVSAAVNAVRNTVSNAWNAITSKVSAAVNAVRNTVSNVFNAVRSVVSSVMEAVRSKISSAWESAKSVVSGAVNGIKNKISGGFNSAKATVSSTFNSIKEKISDKINAAKEAVSKAVEKIKGYFPLKIGKIFSSIRLPSFHVDPGSPPYGLGGAGKKPSFSVSWNAKAMDSAYLLDGATIFGAMGGNLLGGGEAGREIIIGEQKALDMISKASGNQELLERVNYLIRLLEYYLPKRTSPNGRELDRMLGALL